MLRSIATIMFSTWYSALSDRTVVRAPAPAMSGKMIGTMVAEPPGPWYLNISISRTISQASMRMMIEPATAKDWISTPKRDSMASPRNRNSRNMTDDSSAAFPASTLRPLSLRPMMTGVDPVMSITANRTMKALNISLKLKFKSIF